MSKGEKPNPPALWLWIAGGGLILGAAVDAWAAARFLGQSPVAHLGRFVRWDYPYGAFHATRDLRVLMTGLIGAVWIGVTCAHLAQRARARIHLGLAVSLFAFIVLDAAVWKAAEYRIGVLPSSYPWIALVAWIAWVAALCTAWGLSAAGGNGPRALQTRIRTVAGVAVLGLTILDVLAATLFGTDRWMDLFDFASDRGPTPGLLGSKVRWLQWGAALMIGVQAVRASSSRPALWSGAAWLGGVVLEWAFRAFRGLGTYASLSDAMIVSLRWLLLNHWPLLALALGVLAVSASPPAAGGAEKS